MTFGLNRKRLRRVGLWFMVAGAVLAALGFYGLNTTVVNCPNNGCSPAVLWAIYGPYEVAIWSGAGLLVSGAGMTILSFFAPDADAKVGQNY